MRMHRFKFHKYLIVQVSFFVTIVSIVTITYLSSYISHQQSDAVSAQLKNHAIVVASNLAAASGSFVITSNFTSIEEILLRTAKFEGITSMQIVDADGNTLSHVARNEKGDISAMFDRWSFEVPDGTDLVVNQTTNNIEIYNPIILGDVVGWVRLVYSLDSIKQAKTDIWVNNFISGFLITVITIVLLILLLRQPLTSIRKYTDFADRLNLYNGDNIPIDTRSVELSRLGTALNSASENLHNQQAKLQAMLDDRERIASIAEHSLDIVLSIDINQSIEYLNIAAKNTIRALYKSDDENLILKLLPENIEEILAQCISQNLPISDIESSAKKHIYLWKFMPLSSQNVMHCHAIDITEKKLAEEKLVYQANYDSITGLPNRVLALDRLKQSIIRSNRLNNNVGILFLNVERLKSVNETLGHGFGDNIIKAVSVRLNNCTREGDTLARFGDSQFLIILNDLNNGLDSKEIAEKIIDSMSKVFNTGDQSFYLGVSIGIATCPDDGTDASKLVRNADMSLHRAIENGGNTYQYYASKFNEQVIAKVEMESELRLALENNELSLNYQPQINIINNRLVGAEALIRWNSKRLGFVPPDQFIPMAEDINLIIPIGEWVLETACIEAKKWQTDMGYPLRVAVNVSGRQLIGQDFPSIVKNVLQKTGLAAEYLELEITESLLVEDAHDVVDSINKIKQLGVKFALDDFGTGYSSLSYLKRFPFDILKIDRAFVKDVTENPEDASLCKAIVAIAESLKLSVIGEGVETKEQLDFLRAIGADMVQGYYFSKPLEPRAFLEYQAAFREQYPVV